MLVLKIMALIVFILKFIAGCISADIIGGQEITYITDIIWYYFKSFYAIADLMVIVMTGVAIGIPDS